MKGKKIEIFFYLNVKKVEMRGASDKSEADKAKKLRC